MAQVSIIENASAGKIASWIARYLGDVMAARRGPVAITVPGGSTPFPVFELLTNCDLDFARLTIWPGDDRIVPEDHPASNTGRIRALFEPVGARVVTLTEEAQVPRFTLAWLGMGADGHIASLFSNADPQVDDSQSIRRLTPDPLPPEAPFDRITLTLPSLLASDTIIVTLGDSAEKRAVFDAAAAGNSDLSIARLLTAATQPVICFA